MSELFWSTCRSAKNWALVPVVKVRISELPLIFAWLDCSVKIVKAPEALSTEPGTEQTLFTLSLLLILDGSFIQSS